MQTCIIHLICNTFRFAPRHCREEMGKDLRPVDRVPTEAAAAERFREFNATWGRQYPVLIEVDGGLDEDLSLEAVARGADVLICGVMTVFAEPGALGPGFHRLS